MSDLIKRLRDKPRLYEQSNGLSPAAMQVWHETACKAADEIERLTAELDDERAANAHKEAVHVNLQAENERLRDLVAELKAAISLWQDTTAQEGE